MRILLTFLFAGALSGASAQCCCGHFYIDLIYPFEEFGPPTIIETRFYDYSFDLNHKSQGYLIPDSLDNFPIALDLDCGYRLIEMTIRRLDQAMALTLYNSPEVNFHLGSLTWRPGVYELYIPDLLEDISLLRGVDQPNLDDYVMVSSESPAPALFEYAYTFGSKKEFFSFNLISDRHLRKEWINYGVAEMEIQQWFRSGWAKIGNCQLREGQVQMDWNSKQSGRFRMVLITKQQRVVYSDFIL